MQKKHDLKPILSFINIEKEETANQKDSKGTSHVAIIGPTGIGKSDLALILAQESPQAFEIISADAYQVYRGFDIGTGKVSSETLQSIPHHFINFLEPQERYSVAMFCKNTQRLLDQQNKHYIIAGGTAFYSYALLHQYPFDDEKTDLKLQKKLEKRFEEEGGSLLLEELREKDPDSAKRIPATHKHALIRALLLSTSPKKASQRRQKSQTPRPDIKVIGLRAPRDIVYKRINKRVETLIKAGWVEEVRALIEYIPEDAPAFKAIGYRDVLDYIYGTISKKSLIERIQQKTRQFAKRQLTWYRKFQNVYWMDSPFI